MRSGLLLFATAALWTAACRAELVRDTTVPDDGPVKARLGKVSLGLDRAAVTAALGPPIREEPTGDSLDPVFHYAGLEVSFWKGGGVAQIRSTNPAHCTSSGVCPGMPTERGDGRHQYPVAAEACWLELVAAARKVVSLEIKCQP